MCPRYVHVEHPGPDATQLRIPQAVVQALQLHNLWTHLLRIILPMSRILLNCDFMLIFQVLEEDIRGATQNINPAYYAIHVYTHKTCLNLPQITKYRLVSLQALFD